MEKGQKNRFEEPSSDYEKAEMDLLKNALQRSYTERFHTMTTLMKMNKMFRQAEIKHKKLPSSD